MGCEEEAADGDGLAQEVAFFRFDVHFIADDVELVRREVIELLGDFQRIGIAERRGIDAVDVQGVGQAAHDERRVVGDQGLSFDEVFQAGLPIFAELIGLREFIPVVAVFHGGQVIFWRTDVEIAGILQFAVVKFSQGQETDGIRLLIGQFQGDGCEVLREAAQFPLFFDRVFIIAIVGLDVVLVQVFDLDMFLLGQFFLNFGFAPPFAQGRREGVEDGGDEDEGDDRRDDVDQGIHEISNPFQ